MLKLGKRALQLAVLGLLLVGANSTLFADDDCQAYCDEKATAKCGAGNYTISDCLGPPPDCYVAYKCKS
jgi:hypothetical protein